MKEIRPDRSRSSGKIRKSSVAAILIAGAAWLLERWTSHSTTKAPGRSIGRSRQSLPGRGEKDEPHASCVIGIFNEERATVEAATNVQKEWPDAYRVYSPNLNEELLQTLKLPRSGTRLWILLGGVIGQLGGWATTIMLSIYYPHRVASMPVIAIPPFAIISFEMMVLFGAGAGFLAVLFYCGLPDSELPPEIFRRFKKDRFGIVLMCDDQDQVVRARMLLEQQKLESIVCL